MQAGFWLSFVAVGVLFASGSPTDAVGVWANAKRMWREQWLMSVCLAPLTLLLFHQVSMVGLFANLLAVPWVTLVVTPLCLLGTLLPAQLRPFNKAQRPIADPLHQPEPGQSHRGPGHRGRRYPCARRQHQYPKLAFVGTRRQD
jgi:predicted membrane metal-binding protein